MLKSLLKVDNIKGLKSCTQCGSLSPTKDMACKNKSCKKALVSSTTLLGLGKATLRGVKRCKSCCTLNGTKGTICKNKACNALLHGPGTKKKPFLDTCKLDTGPFTKVFSVRLRDKGPDFRGFVQLPVGQSSLTENTDLMQSALCFVDQCQGSFKTKVLQCHEKVVPQKAFSCNHISAAMRCSTEALNLPVDSGQIDALPIQHQLKQEVWCLLSESSGPCVQRVSKDAMAVKCQVNTKFPLGYLHATFIAGRTDENPSFSCPCPIFKESARDMPQSGRCAHFYVCICAFLHQEALRIEFECYINIALPERRQSLLLAEREESELHNLLECHVEILEDSMSAILSDVNEVDAAILADALPTADGDADAEARLTEDHIDTCTIATILPDQLHHQRQQCTVDGCPQPTSAFDADSLCILSPTLNHGAIVYATEEQETTYALNEGSMNSLGLFLEEPLSLDLQNTPIIQNDLELRQLMPLYMEDINEKTAEKKKAPIRPQLSFVEWLGSVTESINQHMHYQMSGGPHSLVFQAPQKFFDKLKERMYRWRRKRLASNVMIFTKKDSIPLGTFIKHSWILNSRFHVKRVFDTPQIPLRLVQSFVQSSDGSFSDETQLFNDAKKTHYYKTYLRVGSHKGETKKVPFKIEWIPNILPLSQIGELRVEFEFGHVPSLINDSSEITCEVLT